MDPRYFILKTKGYGLESYISRIFEMYSILFFRENQEVPEHQEVQEIQAHR
jgi:hypothetical protein